MSLRVNCPNGCQFQISNKLAQKHAGKLVRCPKCKATVRIKASSSKSEDSGLPTVTTGATVEPEQDWTDFQIVTEDSIAQDMDAALIEKITLAPTAKVQIDRRSETEHSQGRIERARQDRILLSRIAAVFIILVGLINLVPAMFHWYQWSQDPLAVQLPRWIYFLVFIAAIHFLYALFVLQIPDWSALRSVSVVMLIEAAVCGFVSVGILLGGVNSPTVSYLGLQYSMLNSASIWCVAMLLLAIVTCYLTAKESFNWQQIDRLLQQAESNSGTAANE